MDASNQYKIGDRVKLIKMANDPDPVPKGTEGEVTHVQYISSFKETQVGVKWDNGRSISVILPEDQIIKIK